MSSQGESLSELLTDLIFMATKKPPTKATKKRKAPKLKLINLEKERELRKPIDLGVVEMLKDMTIDASFGNITSVVGVYIDDAGQEYEFTACDVGLERKMFGVLNNLILNFREEYLIEYELDE